MSATLAERLAAFVHRAIENPATIPERTMKQAAQRFLDNLGCIAFGRQVPPAVAAAELATSLGRGSCRVLGSRQTTSPTAAAFAHGTLAQAFELNDLGVYVHPGACIVPAVLGAADLAVRKPDGRTLLAAVAAGYEVTIRISECIGSRPELEIGWHTPPFHGAIGAAVAASALLGANPQTIAQALVIAADLCGGGLMLARLGTDAKRLHCGRGAEAGVLSALLAQAGTRSRLDTLEHRRWGYCRTIRGDAGGLDLESIEQGLGAAFVAFDRTAVKYYPVGAEVLGVIDNINRMKREHDFTASDVAQITIGTPRFFHEAQPHVFPASVSEVHFNMEYGAAMALHHDIRPAHEVGPAALHDWMHGYLDPPIRAMASRVHHVVDDELERRNPYGIDSTLAITLASGRTLEARSDYVAAATSRGTMKFAPMDEATIVRKFKALTQSELDPNAQDAIVEHVLGCGAFDLETLWRLLTASRPDEGAASGPKRAAVDD